MANKRKTTTAVVAGVTAVALLLGGTFAWTSISQTAKNEAAGVVNVGGRLHDDFNGENKDVYVENFTDPYDGGQPIYARVRLDEYMEVGKEAGGNDADNNGTVDAVPVINDTSRDDVTTWKPHVPAGACEKCESGDTCLIHDHWKWTMGGETVFMPTFNKDKDSLDADVNGTYHGTDDTDKVYYDDYVEYTTNPDDPDNKKVYSKEDTAYYDNDPDTEVNNHETLEGVRTETETHTAKQTANGTVILMENWDGTPGNYWVYDTDGWAYWANPIMPGEATGLLLDGIVMEKNPGEKCYYAINVVGQFATAGDWEPFDTETSDAPSEDAMKVLETAVANVATVTVTNVSGETLLEPAQSYEFSASISVNGQQVLAAGDFEWSVLNADLTANTKSTITDGMLNVAENETAENLIVVAKAKDDAYLGALGMCSVAVTPAEYAVAIEKYSDTIDVGENLYLDAQVTRNGETDDSGVTWSVTGCDTATISDYGTLTVGTTEHHNTKLTVTATSVANPEVYDTFEVTVYNGYELLSTVEEGSDTVVRIDGLEWYILKQDTENNRALIWAEDVIRDVQISYDWSGSVRWDTSNARSYLNNDFYNSLDVLKTHAVDYTIYTGSLSSRYSDTFEYIETVDKIFLLSEADVFGTASRSATYEPKEFTLGVCEDIVPDFMQPSMEVNWLRSPGDIGRIMAIYDSGGVYSNGPESGFHIRPAMWVELSE